MIVDDLEVLRYDLKRMKIWGEQTGFTIEGEAENGRDALNKLRASSFDVLITDIRMPVMDGMDLLKEVSKEKLCPCIVLLSDYTEYYYAREGLIHGAFDYLGKPVDQKKILELLGRVKIFLDERKQEQEKIRQWEGMAEEAFFPIQHVDIAASLFIRGDYNAIEAIKTLLESIGAALDYDAKKSAVILENATETIFTRIMEEHQWINQYTNIESFKHLDLKENSNWNEICSKVLDRYSQLLEFLTKFIIWREGETPVKKACLQVLGNIEKNATVKSIADSLYISKAYLSEMFKQATGVSLSEYISMVKIERAKFLLTNSTLKNYEIANLLGYNDHEYFSKVFKKNMGVSPTIYRKENAIF